MMQINIHVYDSTFKTHKRMIEIYVYEDTILRAHLIISYILIYIENGALKRYNV